MLMKNLKNIQFNDPDAYGDFSSGCRTVSFACLGSFTQRSLSLCFGVGMHKLTACLFDRHTTTQSLQQGEKRHSRLSENGQKVNLGAYATTTVSANISAFANRCCEGYGEAAGSQGASVFPFGQGLLCHMSLLTVRMPGQILHIHQHGILFHMKLVPQQQQLHQFLIQTLNL